MSPPLITEFAPAKVNLTLHVTGLRRDGYHLLDSLVAFCGIGDRVMVQPAQRHSMTLTGRFAPEVPSGDDNLVMRAATAFGGNAGFAVTLEKNLPVASGLGGGSADAAAAIRAILRMNTRGDDDDHRNSATADAATVLSLGSDVPVCLGSRPARMRGVGEQLEWLAPLPETYIALVNPRVALPTSAVFGRLDTKTNPPMPDVLPGWPDALALADWLVTMRNDLDGPARSLAPVIGDVLGDLAAQPGALLTRMSGSGATCFALFSTFLAAENAATAIGNSRPAWWTAAGPLLGAPEDRIN